MNAPSLTRSLDTTDTRTLKAVRLSKTAASWIRCRSKVTGRPLAFGIPSASRPGLFHLVTLRSCDCEDSRRGNYCFHRRACFLYVETCKRAKGAA